MPPFEIEAELGAIDATLAGEAVDPVHAELAELALLLAAERPRIDGGFARELDRRVARRFEPEPPPADGDSRRAVWLRRPLLAPAAGCAVAAVVAVAVLAGGGGGSVSSGGPGIGKLSAPALKRAPSSAASTANSSSAGGSQALTTPQVQGFGSSSAYVPGPVPAAPSGRKQIQSGNLQLTTASAHVDDVAQELFTVVGQENGIVRNSDITASAAYGSAYFSLSIPSANLADTLGRLSTLRFARVASRTDSTQDVNDQYGSDVRRLADARALRTSLLRQLAAAVTTEQVNSLTARIHDAEASISSDEATLRGLQHQISFSSLSVQINAGPTPVPLGHAKTSGGGFTLGRAAHDAVRVLTVAAGVALIVLAALIPLGLLVALAAWIGYWLRRRRREQTLDTA